MKRPWLAPLVVAAMLAFAAAVYSQLPERVPTHWNFQGEVDGWTDRFPGAFLLPAIALGVWLLLLVLPRIDPRRAHYERFRDTYWLILNLMVLFFAVMHVLSLGAALAWEVNMTRAVFALLGLTFMGLGNYLPRVRSNWWIGVRTPWTLESERVWRETHRVAGRTFVAGGAAALVAALLPAGLATPVAMSGLVAAGLIPLIYSYLAWRREQTESGA